MEFKKMHLFGILIGLVAVVGVVAFFWDSDLRYFLLVIALLVGTIPFMISFVLEQSIQKEKENKFLEFIRDLVETVKSGTPVVKGIMNLQNRNYGALSPHVVKLANQLSIGPLLLILLLFLRKILEARSFLELLA